MNRAPFSSTKTLPCDRWYLFGDDFCGMNQMTTTLSERMRKKVSQPQRGKIERTNPTNQSQSVFTLSVLFDVSNGEGEKSPRCDS